MTVIFISSSISNGLLFCFVNQTSMDWNPALVVFNIVNEWGAIVINWPNCLLGTKVNNTLMLVDDCYWLNYNVVK